jgi:hypothetical protein
MAVVRADILMALTCDEITALVSDSTKPLQQALARSYCDNTDMIAEAHLALDRIGVARDRSGYELTLVERINSMPVLPKRKLTAFYRLSKPSHVAAAAARLLER